MFTLILDETLKELTVQGTRAFPFEIYLGGATDFDKGYLDWHWHDTFEINMVVSGTLHYFIENKKYLLQPGDAIFINSGRLHSGHSGYPTQVSHTIVFGPDLLCGDLSSEWYSAVIEDFIHSDVSGLVLNRQTPWMARILDRLETIYETYNTRTPESMLSIKGLMCTIFADMLSNTHTSRPTAAETEKSRRIRLMLTHIAQNYMHPITLADLSSLTGLSEAECSRFFSNQMKQTPFAYLNRYRIERSCELLTGTDLSISEIALQTGFNSFSYYSKRFRELMGCSPSEYREKILNARSISE